ncbi:YhgE/Pip domain-containing protein [Collinsella tanakaei]|jgi:putative membrane protein|uniref:YhgE/Pip domain-containing protein n=1 Tax=Collinsella tanakaei TaxID=626935 RepID=UPI0022E5E5AF|nr:YhgE/Pip domain-containing protein [Collinsella tanakaei]
MVLVKKAFQIFKRDILRLLKNPVALVITIGVCVIPSLYAWYNIVANWDPYGNTANIKVAVANNDQGTSNEYVGELNAGDETVSKLKENDQLGWVFTDADTAVEGVKSGEYYAAIIIPDDFSTNLTSMLTGTFTQPQLEYYCNEKKNAIAPKVTDTGAQTVEEQINETFVATVSETLVEKIQNAAGDLDAQGAETQGGILENVQRSNQALQDVRDALAGMQKTIATSKEAGAKADETLSALSGQIPSLVNALDKGDALLASARTSSRNFASSLNTTLSHGLTQMGKASSNANVAVGKLSGAISAAGGKVDGALADVQMVINDVNRIIIDIREITGIDSGLVLSALEEQLAELQTLKDALQDQSTDIQNSAGAIAGAVSSLDSATQQGISAMEGVQQDMASTVLPQLSQGMDSFSEVSGDLTGVVASLEPTIAQARGVLAQLTTTLDQASSTMSQADSSLEKLQGTLSTAANDVAALRASESLDKLDEILGASSADLADFMSSPVTLTTKAVYPVSNYGSGVAPFYTNLALWVGGCVLIAIIKLEVDGEGIGAFTATEGYFGRWLLLVVLGFVQAFIVCCGDLVLGMQCLRPELFVLAGIFTSFVYVNIIYALASAFKHIGKALVVILVIVQIPGSSGMYPIEMMPDFFQRLHPLLPFTYGISAMRETIGGMYGMDYAINLGVLAVFLAVALFIGVKLRTLMLNLNLLFDKELERTGVMICEKDDRPRERFSLRWALRAMLDTAGYREDLILRAARFEERYPKLIKAGFMLVFGLPVVLFILTATLDLEIEGKIIMLVLWIVSVIVADTYMIVVEYIRESMQFQLRIAELPDDALVNEIRSHTTVLPGSLAVKVAHDGADEDKDVAGDHSAPRAKHMKGGDQ